MASRPWRVAYTDASRSPRVSAFASFESAFLRAFSLRASSAVVGWGGDAVVVEVASNVTVTPGAEVRA